MQNYYVYIMASRPRGTLYTGVTSNLVKRVWEHRTGALPGFMTSHDVKRLVWFETHGDVNEAITREKRIKRWRRGWKYDLIERDNHAWADLWDELVREVPVRRAAWWDEEAHREAGLRTPRSRVEPGMTPEANE